MYIKLAYVHNCHWLLDLKLFSYQSITGQLCFSKTLLGSRWKSHLNHGSIINGQNTVPFWSAPANQTSLFIMIHHKYYCVVYVCIVSWYWSLSEFIITSHCCCQTFFFLLEFKQMALGWQGTNSKDHSLQE